MMDLNTSEHPEERGNPAERVLFRALAEALGLQKHYAELLNAYDGGARDARVFADPLTWIRRLQETGAIPAGTLPGEARAKWRVTRLPPEDGEAQWSVTDGRQSLRTPDEEFAEWLCYLLGTAEGPWIDEGVAPRVYYNGLCAGCWALVKKLTPDCDGLYPQWLCPRCRTALERLPLRHRVVFDRLEAQLGRMGGCNAHLARKIGLLESFMRAHGLNPDEADDGYEGSPVV